MDQFSSFLHQLKERVSLLAEVSAHVKLKRKGRDWWGCCPYHQEKTASFMVNDLRRSYHCFGCGAHGDVITFVQDQQGLSFWETLELLANKANLPLPDRKGHKDGTLSTQPGGDLYQVLDAACTWFQEQLATSKGETARRYLKERGILRKSLMDFRLGFAPSQGLSPALQAKGFSEDLLYATGLIGRGENGRVYERFRDRLIFPIHNRKNQVVAFGGRLLGPGEPKYLNSPETTTFQKGMMLYAWPQAFPHVRTGQPLLIAEGYMDVIALHQAGFGGAVAPLGTALTEEQLRQIWYSCDQPILCFDGDSAGRKAAHKAAERALGEIRPGKSLRFCLLPPGEDPDSFLRNNSPQAFRELLDGSLDLVDVVWSHLLQKTPLQTPEQKAVVEVEIGHLTNLIQDATIKRFYRQELLHRFEKELQRLTILTPAGVLPPKNGRENFPFPKKERERTVFAPLSSRNRLLSLSETQERDWGCKILLATLINHPTLVGEVSEQLVNLTIFSLELKGLRDALLSWAQERFFQSIGTQKNGRVAELSLGAVVENNNTPADDVDGDLQGALYEFLHMRGFQKTLIKLLSPALYLHALFARPTAPLAEARQGWQEIWQHAVGRRLIEEEVLQQAQCARETLNAENWERFKALKYNLVLKDH